MNKQEKLDALMTVVKAYLERGKNLQYDQRSMDRVIQLTPRRMKQLPPEAATEQFTLFLDCSSYMNSLIRETFDYDLPSELTWNMIDLVENRIFFREFVPDEAVENVNAALSEMRKLIEVGDIITFTRNNGGGRSGHTVMYIGEDNYTHLSTRGRPNSYDYVEKKSREYETGVFVDSLTELLEKKIPYTGGGLSRISLARPLDVVGEPTKNTIARCTSAKGLVTEVTASHHYGKTAKIGEVVEYTVTVKSTCADMNVKVKLEAPYGTTLLCEGIKSENIKLLEAKSFSFSVRVDSVNAYHVDAPCVNVNGLDVFAHKVPIGNMLTDTEAATLNAKVKAATKSGYSFSAIRNAYSEIGIALKASEADHIRSLFAFHDAVGCDVLSRNDQRPDEDMALYSYFGGTRVTTPEMVSKYYIRTNKPKRTDLAPGDIILLAADATATVCYSCYYTGNELIGRFEDTDEVILTEEKIDAFVDSLIGRFAFVVLRPALVK